jgi:hypothetical protein
MSNVSLAKNEMPLETVAVTLIFFIYNAITI